MTKGILILSIGIIGLVFTILWIISDMINKKKNDKMILEKTIIKSQNISSDKTINENSNNKDVDLENEAKNNDIIEEKINVRNDNEENVYFKDKTNNLNQTMCLVNDNSTVHIENYNCNNKEKGNNTVGKLNNCNENNIEDYKALKSEDIMKNNEESIKLNQTQCLVSNETECLLEDN